MIGPTPFRDILLVAGFELRELLRTRRALMISALFVLAGLLASWLFVSFLAKLEEVASNALGTVAAAKPGALTQQMLSSPEYRAALKRLFNRNDVADFALSQQPIILFFFSTSLIIIPLLIMLTAADTVVQETQHRGVRFVAFRTGRLEFVFGKYLGQALLVALVTLLTGLSEVLVAANGLQGFEWEPALRGLLIFWPRLLVYAISFVGLCGMLSMNASSLTMARSMALLGLALVWGLSELPFWPDAIEPVIEVIRYFIPFHHKQALWDPILQNILQTGGLLLVLSVLYLFAGLIFFRRRDF